MTKINLNPNRDKKPSMSHDLTNDEAFAVEYWFSQIKENYHQIPDNLYEDMCSIETFYLKHHKLSDKQMKYIQDVCEEYC